MDRPANPVAHGIDRPLADCIEAAEYCQRTLREYARNGARAGPGLPAERALWRLMLDCAELCAATVDFARTESVFLLRLAESCGHLCDECAAAGERAEATPALAVCAEACRVCASRGVALQRLNRRAPVAPRALHP
ncbi:MAG: hypothetical protein ACK558_01680 [Pseudomonadota bacterium]